MSNLSCNDTGPLDSLYSHRVSSCIDGAPRLLPGLRQSDLHRLPRLAPGVELLLLHGVVKSPERYWLACQLLHVDRIK